MKRIKAWRCRLTVAALLLGIGVFSPIRVWADNYYCLCKAILDVGPNAASTINNPIIDLGLVETYASPHEKNAACTKACRAAAAKNAQFNNKTWLCQQIKKEGAQRVSAYSGVGVKGGGAEPPGFTIAQEISFACSGGGTVCTCPTGWETNATTGRDAGGANDGKCKKLAGQITAVAPPANGTQLGSWGFSWGKDLYEWGTRANGGAPQCKAAPWVGK